MCAIPVWRHVEDGGAYLDLFWMYGVWPVASLWLLADAVRPSLTRPRLA